MSIEEPPSTPEPTPIEAPLPAPEAAPEPPVVEAEESPNTDSPAARSNSGLKLAVAALAVISLILAVVGANLSARNRELKERTEDVSRAAAAMGSALLTYDYRELPKTKAVVLKLATGTFEKQYTAAFNGGLDTVLTNSKAVSQVRDIEVYVSDVTSSQAAAIVVVETVVSGTAGDNRSLTSYIRLDLVNTDDGWLIDGVTNLNLGLPTGSTTPTTAAGSPQVTTTTR